MRRAVGRLAVALVPATMLAAVATTLVSVVGYAHCHAFSVSASPGSVNEGTSTTATVSRDGNVAPSSVRIDSVDGTAVAGRDYVAVHEVVNFTSELAMPIRVSTIHSPAHEGSQTFRLQLSGGGGCTGAGYAYGAPATVTVIDIDPAPAPTPTHAPATMAPPATGPPATATTAPPAAPPTPTPALEAVAAPLSPSSEPTPTASPGSSRVLASASVSSGGPAAPILLLGAVTVVALAAGAFYLYRRHMAG